MQLSQKVNFKAVFGNIGLLIHIPAIMALISLPICFIFKEYYACIPLLVTAAIGIGIGQLLYQVFFKKQTPHLWDAMIIASVSWLLCSIIGALPLFWIANAMPSSATNELTNVTNALFEAFSGFTSTGLTMLKFPENLPHTIQWWRSLMQWIGGLGLMVFILSLTHLSKEGYQLYYAEAHTEKIGKNVKSTSQVIWGIYILYTLFGILLFLLLKMPLWEAINHTMTLISTGGFSILNTKFQNYSAAIQLAGIVLMILGAINFAVHYHVIREGKIQALWKNAQQRHFYAIIFLGAALIYGLSLFSGEKIQPIQLFFEWTSAITTCGLSVIPLSDFKQISILLLIMAMFAGACAGSTAGGLKIQRLMHLFSGILLRIKTIMREKEKSILKAYEASTPKSEEPKEVELAGQKKIETLYAAGILFFAWTLTLMIGWFFMLFWAPERSAFETLFDVISAMSNAGLTSGIINSEFHPLGKYLFMGLMWLGRLEIIPALILILSILFPAKRQRA
ncbi:MAG: TrkH family potassium uptake protein [Simkaniaceae bacterium]|nr:TrkH family potassium uptake protein [Simkaniaceae bacterium]